MVRKSASQGRIVGMWLRIVPVQPFSPLTHRVAIALDGATSKVQVFPHCEGDIIFKLDGSENLSEGGSVSNDYQSRLPDRRRYCQMLWIGTPSAASIQGMGMNNSSSSGSAWNISALPFGNSTPALTKETR